jgi:hypothetical protein
MYLVSVRRGAKIVVAWPDLRRQVGTVTSGKTGKVLGWPTKKPITTYNSRRPDEQLSLTLECAYIRIIQNVGLDIHTCTDSQWKDITAK